MSARMELEDLPPRYRAQAEAQIAARRRGKCVSPQAIPDAARTAGKLGKAFESRGEYEYYMSVIVPGIQSGKILKATTHVAFPLLPAKEYGNVKLPAARYTADYVLKYADGGGRDQVKIHPAAAAGLYLPPPPVHRPHCRAERVEIYGNYHTRHQK